MKILYVTTIGATMNFFREFVDELIKDGNTVDIATNETTSVVPEFYKNLGCKVYPIETSRSPLQKGNVVAIKQIRKLVTEEHYDIVHCHTPIAAMCTRLACRKVRKQGTKVFYTAHGFHFYKGAPLKNWLLYYPVEKICAHFTDVLITINQEDYELAQKKMKAKKVVYVPGVGIDLEKFGNASVDKDAIRRAKREELGIPQDAKLLLSVGELNENKNHETVIRAIAKLDKKIRDNVYYVIAGKGDRGEYLKRLIEELNLTTQVVLLGFRSDIGELCYSADIFCFPSYREGLGLGAIEGMACGLPIITSNVHGINDYSEDDVTGYKCAPADVNGFAESIQRLVVNDKLCKKFGEYNAVLAKKYDVNHIIKIMENLYERERKK